MSFCKYTSLEQSSDFLVADMSPQADIEYFISAYTSNNIIQVRAVGAIENICRRAKLGEIHFQRILAAASHSPRVIFHTEIGTYLRVNRFNSNKRHRNIERENHHQSGHPQWIFQNLFAVVSVGTDNQFGKIAALAITKTLVDYIRKLGRLTKPSSRY